MWAWSKIGTLSGMPLIIYDYVGKHSFTGYTIIFQASQANRFLLEHHASFFSLHYIKLPVLQLLK